MVFYYFERQKKLTKQVINIELLQIFLIHFKELSFYKIKTLLKMYNMIKYYEK